MVGITRDLGKQRQLIFPVATKGNAWRVFVFFGLRKTRFRNGFTTRRLEKRLIGGFNEPHKIFSTGLERAFLSNRRVCHWTFSAVRCCTQPLGDFPSALIYRPLDFFKIIFPIVQFAKLCVSPPRLMRSLAIGKTCSQNKCVPCELADWRVVLADWILPHVKECLRIQSRAKPSVKNVVTTHRLLFAQLHPKRVSTGYTKDATSSNKNTCKQILLKRQTSSGAKWDRIKKLNLSTDAAREEKQWVTEEGTGLLMCI